MSHNHSFDVHFAIEFKNVELAILIWHFQYWILKNKRLKRNQYEGRTWTYQTIAEVASAFPYWSFKQVERLLNKMIEEEILIKGNFNKAGYDRTVWYAFKDEEKFGISKFQEMDEIPIEFRDISRNREMDFPKSGNGFPEIGKPIPDTLPNTLTNKEEGATAPPTSKRSKKSKKSKNPIIHVVENGICRFEGITPERLQKLKISYPNVDVDKCLNQMANHSFCERRKYGDYTQAIEAWMRNEQKAFETQQERKEQKIAEKKQIHNSNELIAHNLVKHCPRGNTIVHRGPTYIEFVRGQYCANIKLDDPNFESLVAEEARKAWCGFNFDNFKAVVLKK